MLNLKSTVEYNNRYESAVISESLETATFCLIEALIQSGARVPVGIARSDPWCNILGMANVDLFSAEVLEILSMNPCGLYMVESVR